MMESFSKLKEIKFSFEGFLPNSLDIVSVFLKPTKIKGTMKVKITKYPLETAVNLKTCKTKV